MKRFLLVLLVLILPLPALGASQAADATDTEVKKGSYVVTFDKSMREGEVRESAKKLARLYGGEVSYVYEMLPGFAIERLAPDSAVAMGANFMVKRIVPNLILYRADSAGQQFPAPWGLDRIDQRLLLTNGFYDFDHMGTGVNVYVLDTGIRTTHTDFGGRASWGINCVGAGQTDGHGHGTAMASIIGGATNGVAKDANLIAVKVLNNQGVGTLAQVLCGVNWVTANAVAPAVANMSLSGPGSITLDNAVTASINSGVFYSVSAGNNASGVCNRSPARVAAAMTAAASELDLANSQDVKASFSNFGLCVDLFAPGVDIPAAWNTNDTATQNITGTSASATHASGVAAAWLESNPAFTPAALSAQILADATVGQINNPMGAANLLLYRKLVAAPSIAAAPTGQRVYDMITLTGSGFGTNFVPGATQLLYADATAIIESTVPYVWRDDFIQARVPPGDTVNGFPTQIPLSPLVMAVVNANGVSNLVPFQVTSALGILTFQELTQIIGNMDMSSVFGTYPNNFNITRTKDAEVGDVNGDGWPDLVDNNSNNSLWNLHHGIVRFNNQNGTFTPATLEPHSLGDPPVPGFPFLTTVPAPPVGTFIENATTYDSDLVDLTNDGLPELVETLRLGGGTTELVRVLVNNNGGPGLFLESTNAWFGPTLFPGSPDDMAHTDVDHDGFVDIAVAYRSWPPGANGGGQADIFFNQGGTNFVLPGTRMALTSGSTHDIFFVDADADGFRDAVLVNESGNSEWFANPGFTTGTALPFATAVSGIAADFNADGLEDIALSRNDVTIFFNDPLMPGNFTAANSITMPNGFSSVYDLEPGDVDLDGSIDLVAISISASPDSTVRVWLNNGFGTVFTDATGGATTNLLPGSGPYQRLSADLIDLDLDGDLDLYITGADGQDVGGPLPGGQPFGRVPNQLWENLLIP